MSFTEEQVFQIELTDDGEVYEVGVIEVPSPAWLNLTGDNALEVVASGPALVLDLTLANWFDVTLDQDCAITWVGADPAFVCVMKIIVRQNGAGGHGVEWDPAIIWIGEPPEVDPTPGALTLVSGFTTDGGVTWYGLGDPSGGELPDPLDADTLGGLPPEAFAPAAPPVSGAGASAADQLFPNVNLTDVAGLVFDIAPGEAKNFDFTVTYDGSNASDLKMTVTAPAGSTGWFGLAGVVVGSTPSGGQWQSSVKTVFGVDTLVVGSGAQRGLVRVMGHIKNDGAEVGQVKLQAAQNTADATATRVFAGACYGWHRA